jgi:alpha-glucosidase (family GH31 glycosyl hydrolase)
MNEDAIARELADALPHEEVRDYSYPTPEAPKQEFVDKMLPEEMLTQRELMDYLGVTMQERHNPMVADYMKAVYEWARETAGTGDINHLLRVISEQEQHMGSRLKGDRLRRLGEYVKINRLRQSLAARERALYG